MDAGLLDNALGTMCSLLDAEGESEAAHILRVATARCEEVGYDNLNGGTELWDVILSLDTTEYAKLGNRRENLIAKLDRILKEVTSSITDNWYSIKIVPLINVRPDWRAAGPTLSTEARRDIADTYRSGVTWSGALDDVSFLKRLYDLQNLPSNDSRYSSAEGDIHQHRINNDDWDDSWIFDDSRFGLMTGSPDNFLRFVCETINPLVRPDQGEARLIAEGMNNQLRREGWELVEQHRMGGRWRYAARRATQHSSRAISRAKSAADVLDADHMETEIERLERAIESDPGLAIGTAKELVESCCKSILTIRGISFTRSADVGDLTKLLARALDLVPDGISDQAKGADNIKSILRSLSAIPHHLALLRGLYGSGHGRDGSHKGLEARHARLAVNAAVSFIDFVTETHRQRGK
ncbi:abortive infection family protein [Pseudomonas sp. NPDC088368]|uniref:abortive infection family protein n=1 Tax=Pseudomonas sp. NPDC088368 TaxID=3364453 RepID=UPI0037F2B050